MRKPDYGYTSFHGLGGVFILGMGTLVLGVVVMLVYAVARPAFFRNEVALAAPVPEQRPAPAAVADAATTATD
jgi:hypothetical protein